jgi:hypothetical protein
MDKQMTAVFDKVRFSIPDDIVRVEEGDNAWLFTTHGLIQWVFENASSEGLNDFITLWDSVGIEEKINIIVDIAQAKTND